MDLVVAIDDSKVANFTTSANDTLKVTCNDYANAIVEETKSIENADRATNAPAEIISSHIKEAEKNIENHLLEAKKYYYSSFG